MPVASRHEQKLKRKLGIVLCAQVINGVSACFKKRAQVYVTNRRRWPLIRYCCKAEIPLAFEISGASKGQGGSPQKQHKWHDLTQPYSGERFIR